MTTCTKLAACLLNISEARNDKVVEAIAKAAVSGKGNSMDNAANQTVQGFLQSHQTTVLNIFRDFDYNRSVLTIAAQLPTLQHSIYNACVEAYHYIDLSQQTGIHPRLGAVDLIPIYPLSRDVSLVECGDIAKAVASNLVKDVPGSSFFLFGMADQPENRGLVQRRKDIGWFAGKQGVNYKEIKQDMGVTPTSRYGITGIGASLYVTNCNVTIATQDIHFGHQIAKAIRASNPRGLPGVQAMAFTHEGNVEIACNVESTFTCTEDVIKKTSEQMPLLPLSENELSSSDNLKANLSSHYTYTPSKMIEARVRKLAKERGVSLIGTSLVGFTPNEAHRLAVKALTSGQLEYWKTRRTVTIM